MSSPKIGGTHRAEAVLTQVEGRVLTIWLNRPDAMNAIDSAMTSGLLDALARLNESPELSVGVMAAHGRGYSAGMDLKEFARSGPPKGIERLLRTGAEKPLVGAIEGFALAGGLELALICDLLVAGRSARFGLPECSVGLVPGGGGLLRLAQRLPLTVALEMIFTADPITATQAYEYGLVSRLVDDGTALAEAVAVAQRIARNAPLALTACKSLVRTSHGYNEDEFWAAQRPVVAEVFRSEDAREGARAFAEKRQPEWAGR